jgi:hypothetical protein
MSIAFAQLQAKAKLAVDSASNLSKEVVQRAHFSGKVSRSLLKSLNYGACRIVEYSLCTSLRDADRDAEVFEVCGSNLLRQARVADIECEIRSEASHHLERDEVVEACQHRCLSRHVQQGMVLGMVVVVADEQVEQAHFEELFTYERWLICGCENAANGRGVETTSFSAAPFVFEFCR